jgi:hypothetical protein
VRVAVPVPVSFDGKVAAILESEEEGNFEGEER